MRISDWSSDVCSSDLPCVEQDEVGGARIGAGGLYVGAGLDGNGLPDGNAEAPANGRRAFGRLPAVKLERGEGAGGGQARQDFVRGIDQHGDPFDMGRDRRGEGAQLVRFDMPGAFRKMDEAQIDGKSTRLNSSHQSASRM